MPHFPQALSRTRSPRVRVPGGESVNFRIGNRQISATLRKLSMTGGLVEFPVGLGDIPLAEVVINTVSGPIKALVEFLKPRHDGDTARPFRMVALDDHDYERLSATLKTMRSQGQAE